MAFSSAFKALCSDPWGEALQVQLYVRLNDGTGGVPGTLVTLTTNQSVLSLNPIRRRRERKFGVIQGQSWQASVTNADLDLLDYDLKGCWCAVYGEFPTESESAIFAQGKIAKVTTSTAGTVTIEVTDSVMDVLNFALPRDISFQSTGWISGMKDLAKASGSDSYTSTQALTLNTPASADDEAFIVEFTTSATFKIILEDGDESQAGIIGSDCTISNVAGDTGIITIPSAGWKTTYAAGDQFVFYTARPRTANELTPVYMIQHLIDDVAGLGAYDVLNGAAYSSGRFDTTHWTSTAGDFTSYTIGGEWDKGTPLSRMIQDLLKIVHGSIYPTPTGQIAIWCLSPSTSVGVTLNGNPGLGPVDILEASIIEDNTEAISEVTYEYKSLDGEDATVTETDADTALLEPRSTVIDVGWRVLGIYADDACEKYLNRFKGGVKEYEIKTTLAGAFAEIGEGVSITEGELGLTGVLSDVTDVTVDLLANSATIRAHTDPVILNTYFILGTSTLNGSEVLW